MEPQAAGKLALDVAAGGVSPTVVYALALFVIIVVTYLLKDYISNHKTMILVLQENNAERRKIRKLIRTLMPQSSPRPDPATVGTPRPNRRSGAATLHTVENLHG